MNKLGLNWAKLRSDWNWDLLHKILSQVQASVLGLGVDIVLPLSQQQEQEDEEPPH